MTASFSVTLAFSATTGGSVAVRVGSQPTGPLRSDGSAVPRTLPEERPAERPSQGPAGYRALLTAATGLHVDRRDPVASMMSRRLTGGSPSGRKPISLNTLSTAGWIRCSKARPHASSDSQTSTYRRPPSSRRNGQMQQRADQRFAAEAVHDLAVGRLVDRDVLGECVNHHAPPDIVHPKAFG